jgi:hypothetical protein
LRKKKTMRTTTIHAPVRRRLVYDTAATMHRWTREDEATALRRVEREDEATAPRRVESRKE